MFFKCFPAKVSLARKIIVLVSLSLIIVVTFSGCSPDADTLIERLRDDPDNREEVEDRLVRIGEPAVEPLIVALGDSDSGIRSRAADALIRLGRPETEPILIEAFSRFGDSRMATVFINSGNDQFEAAGRKWAKDNDYIIMPGRPGAKQDGVASRI